MDFLKEKFQALQNDPMYVAQVALSLVVFLVVEIIFVVVERQSDKNFATAWHFLNIYGCIIIGLTPVANTPMTFFKGDVDEETKDNKHSRQTKCYHGLLLAFSSMISWIMAKSIQNTSKLAARFGDVGGWAYAAWYVALPAVGVTCYQIRKQGFKSLPEFIDARYGRLSCLVFAFACGYRLFNEVWSNTIVVASFYDDQGACDFDKYPDDPAKACSPNWWLAAYIGSAIPATYVILGGMNSSLVSDAIQTVLACILLLAVLISINKASQNKTLKDYGDTNWDSGKQSSSLWEWDPDPSTKQTRLEGGMDILIVGLLQGALSYPYFDPALTDRAFLGDKEVMRWAFVLGGIGAIFFIHFFGFIGIFGNMVYWCVYEGVCTNDNTDFNIKYSSDGALSTINGKSASGVKAGIPSAVGGVLGESFENLLALIMITSAISTLDSTFSSVAKLFGPDFHGMFIQGKPLPPGGGSGRELLGMDLHILIGRVMIVVIALTGTLYLYQDHNELGATTVSGTMVPGLGPPVYMAAFFPMLFNVDWNGKALLYKPKATDPPSGGVEYKKKIKKNPSAFLMPFWFAATMGIMYQMYGASPSKNQYPNCPAAQVMTTCGSYLIPTDDDQCAMYESYYSCIQSINCWNYDVKQNCKTTRDSLNCSDSLTCFYEYEVDIAGVKKQQYYSSLVDITGINIGYGSYARLLGTNAVQAGIALIIFLFCISDNFLEDYFDSIGGKPLADRTTIELAEEITEVTGKEEPVVPKISVETAESGEVNAVEMVVQGEKKEASLFSFF